MSRKVFTAGEVLAATDVNSFLMDQTVMVFAGTAARGSAISSPTEGMYAHLNDTDTLTYYNGTAWVALNNSAILQVVSTTKTDVFTMSSTTYADVTGLSVTITPSSASSKILVTGSINLATSGFATNAAFFKLLRGSTDIALGNAAGSRIRGYSGTETAATAMTSASFNFLDSPSTVSATTYKAQLASNVSGQTASINAWVSDTDLSTRFRGVSTITVMEVAG